MATTRRWEERRERERERDGPSGRTEEGRKEGRHDRKEASQKEGVLARPGGGCLLQRRRIFGSLL